MRIIKHGNIHDKTKIFMCEYCGCEFEADESEWEKIQTVNPFKDIAYYCSCPECWQLANEKGK